MPGFGGWDADGKKRSDYEHERVALLGRGALAVGGGGGYSEGVVSAADDDGAAEAGELGISGLAGGAWWVDGGVRSPREE